MSTDTFLRPDTIRILGYPIANLSMDAAVAAIGTMVTSRQPHHVVTVNPEFIMEARRNTRFCQVLHHADLAVADGVGLLLAARLQRRCFKARVAGTDLVVRLSQESARQGWRPFFLGAGPGVAGRAVDRLQTRFPGLVVAGCYAGTPTPEETPDLVARVRSAAPDILFVAYGHPTQDLWISANKAALGAPVMMGVGGAFDFIAGVVPRAPRAIQQAGLEWLYRLYQEPWRWRRMLALPRFLILALSEALTP